MNFKIAIVCSDSSDNHRGNLIAKRFSELNEGIKIFHWDNRAWRKWENNRWSRVEKPPEPPEVDLLFQHNSDDLSAHLPKSAIFKKLARFSGGQLIENNDHPDKCNIIIPFHNPSGQQPNTCPLNKHDARQFLDWASGQRKDPPDICLGRSKLSEVHTALVILCDAYLRACPPDQLKKLQSASEIEKLLGEPRLPEHAWIKVQKAKWWSDVLGQIDNLKYSGSLFSLMQAIKASSSDLQPTIVADAYLELVSQVS